MTIVCNVEYVSGQQGGQKRKPSAPKCSEGLRKSSGKLEKLFSSFLRGASCPKSPRVAATAASSFMPERTSNVKGLHERAGQAPPLQRVMSRVLRRELIGCCALRQQRRYGLALVPREMRSEVLRKEWIGFRARNGFLGVLAVFALRPGESDEGSGKFHLRIIAAESGA